MRQTTLVSVTDLHLAPLLGSLWQKYLCWGTVFMAVKCRQLLIMEELKDEVTGNCGVHRKMMRVEAELRKFTVV